MNSHSHMDEEQQNEEMMADTSSSDVVTKYKLAADFVNRVLARIISEAKPNRKIVDLCQLGDELIMKEVSKVYVKGKIEKGIAFPTCLSVNHCAGHFSPLLDDNTVLSEGDIVKIDLGCHLHGFIAVVGHTICITDQSPPPPLKGRKADVFCAAYYAMEAALRLMKPGCKNSAITEVIQKVADCYHINPVEGVLSHELKRFVIDGNNVIMNKLSHEHKVDEFEIKEHEVYGLDILMSTGEGKVREKTHKATVFKRAVDQTYMLKMKASRYVFNEINNRFPTLPFSLRALEEKRGKLGITELISHGLVDPYPVLYEKQGEIVAHFKTTVLILPNHTMKITEYPQLYPSESEYGLSSEIKDLLLRSLKVNPKKKRKKNKAAAAKAAADAAVVEPTNPPLASASSAISELPTPMDTS